MMVAERTTPHTVCLRFTFIALQVPIYRASYNLYDEKKKISCLQYIYLQTKRRQLRDWTHDDLSYYVYGQWEIVGEKKYDVCTDVLLLWSSSQDISKISFFFHFFRKVLFISLERTSTEQQCLMQRALCIGTYIIFLFSISFIRLNSLF